MFECVWEHKPNLYVTEVLKKTKQNQTHFSYCGFNSKIFYAWNDRESSFKVRPFYRTFPKLKNELYDKNPIAWDTSNIQSVKG